MALVIPADYSEQYHSETPLLFSDAGEVLNVWNNKEEALIDIATLNPVFVDRDGVSYDRVLFDLDESKALPVNDYLFQKGFNVSFEPLRGCVMFLTPAETLLGDW